jgi:methyl-accepting chemotaxis protein
MFNQWSLKSKVRGVMGLGALWLLIVSMVGVYNLRTVVKHLRTPDGCQCPKNLLTYQHAVQRKQITAAASRATEEGFDVYAATEEALKGFEENKKKVESLERTSTEDAYWKDFLATWENIKTYHLKNMEDFKADSSKQYKFDNKKYRDLFNKVFAASKKLIEEQAKDADQWSETAQHAAKSGVIISLAMTGAGFALAILLGILFANYLSNRLNILVEKMSDSASNVTDSSHHVSSAGTKLSSSTTEQAAAIQQTVAAIEEVSSMVQKNAENSKRSEDVSTKSQEKAQQGKEAVQAMIHSIDDIKISNTDIMQQIDKSNQQISDIVKVISEIGNKTKIINDIVFQTKLLSFNASVEAARAGEHGKGFAVVAEEIGNLAQMSGNAAKEISQMLGDSIRK